ncbi:glycosyltransferase family 61 protein [Methylobacterium sp. WL7]|uniref:glycosyltransferase family 61 protein n=1 Tax=Methylobacterium sp. WL7 TaxID=2603900 RepID=UPI00164F5CF9|nr:glycosyltransferase family 61 protein [Methylobacterium sp. WL7]
MKDRIEEQIAACDENSAVFRALRGGGENVRFPGTLVHAIKPGWQVYGHWLVDILPALWMYRRLQIHRPMLCNGAKILLPRGIPNWALSLAEMAVNLHEEECVFFDEQRELMHPEMLIVPSLLRIENGFSEIFNDLIQNCVRRFGHLRNGHPRRIFVYRGSRGSFMPRHVVNEEDLVRAAVEFGFVAVDPAALPWPEQVALFAGAEAIIGPFGSGMHNTIFSSHRAVSLVLTNSNMNWIQSGISALRQQTMSYLWPDDENHDANQHTYRYDLERFKDKVREMVAFLEAKREQETYITSA